MSLPSSDIQAVIERFQETCDISQANLLNKQNEKLVLFGVPEADVKTVMDEVKMDDLFQTCNTDLLKTDQRRKAVFKQSLNYIEPVPEPNLFREQ